MVLPAHGVDINEAIGLRLLDAEDHEGMQDLLALDGIHVHDVVGCDVTVVVGGGNRQVLFLQDIVEVIVIDVVVVAMICDCENAMSAFQIMPRSSPVPHTVASQKVAVCLGSLEREMG
jgi:hypothetical protein